MDVTPNLINFPKMILGWCKDLWPGNYLYLSKLPEKSHFMYFLNQARSPERFVLVIAFYTYSVIETQGNKLSNL